jgi:hypothetical protein
MINTVRNTVMAVLNKDNNGYLTPEEFNLFAKQAQLEIFEEYFYNYNNLLNKKNKRLTNTGYADLPRQLVEVIDTFTQFKELTASTNSDQTFELPTDWYTFIHVLWKTSCEVTAESSAEAERVSEYQINKLLSSNLTSPSKEYPAYVFSQQGFNTPIGPGSSTSGNLGNQITLYPSVTISDCSLRCDLTYIRYPKDPKWTYQMVSGSPIFNQSAADYQDFELPFSDQVEMTLKILQYAGVNIREPEVVQFASGAEAINNQSES